MDVKQIAFGTIAGFLASKLLDLLFGYQKETVALMRDVRERVVKLEAHQDQVIADIARLRNLDQTLNNVEGRLANVEHFLVI